MAACELPAEAWFQLVLEAERHGLASHFWTGVARCDPAFLPPGLHGRARAARLGIEERAAGMETSLADIAGALLEHGIRVLTLKGVALGAHCYGDTAMRVGQDLDLLVHEHDVERAVAVLAARGFVRDPRPYALIREDHLVRHEDGLVVDLHWHITGAQFPLEMDFDALWHTRQQGLAADLPEDAWLLLMSVVYLVKDYPEMRLVYLADFLRLAESASSSAWERLDRLATATGTRRLLAVTVEIAGRLAVGVPEEAAMRFPPDRAARAGARRLERTVDRPPEHLQPHLARLVQVIRQAGLRERTSDRLAALGSLWPLLASPTPQDTDLAGRLGTAPGILRPVRLGRDFLASSLAVGKNAMARSVVGIRHDLAAAAAARGLVRLRPAEGVSLHLIDEEGLLFDARAEAIYSLSTSAAWLWCSLEEGATTSELQRAYAVSFGRSAADAEREVLTTLRTWQELGLLDGFGREVTATSQDDPAAAGCEATGPDLPPPAAPAIERHYRLLDTAFRLGLPGPEEAALVEPVLAVFALQAGPSGGGEEVVLQLVRDDDGYRLVRGGVTLDECAELDEIAPVIKAELLVTAINRYHYSFYLHAAMLRAGDACLLLPAAPGSGKTTLSTALARAGFAYHSDEVTLLDEERLAARGVPLCPAVKEGAWPVLEPLYPGLPDLPEHYRADDKIVRYLPPPVRAGDPALDSHWPVRWMVFPRYQAGAGTALRPLSRIEALRRMLDECLAMRLRLDTEVVARLARWIEGVECRELDVGLLDDAVQALRGLCLEPAAAAPS